MQRRMRSIRKSCAEPDINQVKKLKKSTKKFKTEWTLNTYKSL